MKPESDVMSHGCKPRVLLRADAGRRTGFGHYIRTSALADILSDGFECEVVSYDSESGTMAGHNEAFLRLIRPGDVVVLDNYFYDTGYQREVRSRCRALVCVDDMHDRHFVADALFSFCPLSREDFSLEDYTRFYGGLEWAFLRAPFLRPQLRREWPPRVSRVALAMGGSDPFGLTDKMIGVIRRVFPGVAMEIIAGREVAVTAPEGEDLRIWRGVGADTIADIFDRADAGVFPASTVCVEAFARGLPVAAGYYVDNQTDFYRHGVGNGWFLPLGNLLDPSDSLVCRLAGNADDSTVRRTAVFPPAPEIHFDLRRKDIIALFAELADRIP